MQGIKPYTKLASFGGASSIDIFFTDDKGQSLPCNYIKIFAASGPASSTDNYEVYFSGMSGGFAASRPSLLAPNSGDYIISGAGAAAVLRFVSATTGNGAATQVVFSDTTKFDGSTPRSAQFIADYCNESSAFSTAFTASAENNTLRVYRKTTGSTAYIRYGSAASGVSGVFGFVTNTSAYGLDASGDEPIRNDLIAASMAVKLSGQKPVELYLYDQDKVTGVKIAKGAGINDAIIYVVYGVAQSYQNSLAFRGLNIGS